MRLLLLLVAVALARPAPKKVPALPKVVTPSDPGGGAPTHAPPEPSLGGSTQTLQLEGIRRQSTTFRVELDTSALTAGPELTPTLERHLAADPRWRLVERDGGLVALRREEVDGRWVIGPAEHHGGEGGCHRVALRLGALDPGADWASADGVARIPAGASAVELPVFQVPDAPCKGLSATALRVEGPAVSLELLEAARGADRTITFDALTHTLDLVRQVGATGRTVQRDGFDRFSLPRGEPVAGDEPTVTLTSPGPGLLELDARVNPGRRGWTWLRLLDDGLQPWEDPQIGRATRERAGWSDDASLTFLVGTVFPAPSGPAFSGTAELWFQPEDGPPVLLTAVPLDVPAR